MRCAGMGVAHYRARDHAVAFALVENPGSPPSQLRPCAASPPQPAPMSACSSITQRSRARGEGLGGGRGRTGAAVGPVMRREQPPASASCACGQSRRPCRRTSAGMVAVAAGACGGGDGDDRQGCRHRCAENDDDDAQCVVEQVTLLNQSPNRLVGLRWRLAVWVRPPRGAHATDRAALSSMASICRNC